jgi:hypothetical protein
MLSLETESAVFVPRRTACQHEEEHECECGGNCHCGELVEVDNLISELAELALAKNYANIEEFAHYIAQEMLTRIRHHSQLII